MSLLSVVQNAMVMCSQPVPRQVFSSTDDTVMQFQALLYVAGRDLIKRHDWSTLLVTETFTCAATNEQTGYPAANFDRMARGVDMWNTSSDWPIHGPVNANEWSELVVRTVTTLPQYWRLIGGVLNIYAPVAGNTIRYEYVSKNWIFNTGDLADGGRTPTQVTAGSTATFTSDVNDFLVPENLLELGLVWRWKQAKQLDYAEDMRTYEIALKDAVDSDKGGRRIISTDRPRLERPFKTWPGTITPAA